VPAAVRLGATFELTLLGAGDLVERRRRDPAQRHDVVVDDTDATLTDRAHRQLWLRRHTDLAHEYHVDRDVSGTTQHLRGSGGNDDTAARQAEEHDRVVHVVGVDGVERIARQRAEPAPGILAVGEDGQRPWM